MNRERRSLRELHAWAAELASAGVRGLFTGGYTSASRGGGSNLPGGSGKRADSGPGSAQSAPRAGRQKYEQRCLRFAGDRESDASGGRTGEDVDLEQGGSQTSGVAVPFLVVGNKRDVGEGVRGKGEAFAAELGAPHVTVVRVCGCQKGGVKMRIGSAYVCLSVCVCVWLFWCSNP